MARICISSQKLFNSKGNKKYFQISQVSENVFTQKHVQRSLQAFFSQNKQQELEGVFLINSTIGAKHPAQPGGLMSLQSHRHMLLGDKIIN